MSDGDKGNGRILGKATVTRVASDEEGNDGGGKGDGSSDEGGG